jgi:hypothetical protein
MRPDVSDRTTDDNHYLQVRCPVRILHGAADEVVPPFVASEVVAWCESRDVHLTMIKVLRWCRNLLCFMPRIAMLTTAPLVRASLSTRLTMWLSDGRLYASLVPTSKAAAFMLTLPTQDGDHRLSRPEDLCVP